MAILWIFYMIPAYWRLVVEEFAVVPYQLDVRETLFYCFVAAGFEVVSAGAQVHWLFDDQGVFVEPQSCLVSNFTDVVDWSSEFHRVFVIY